MGLWSGRREFENGARAPGAPGKGLKILNFFWKKCRKCDTYVVCASTSTRTWTLD